MNSPLHGDESEERKRASKEPEYAAAARLAKLRTILESGGGTVELTTWILSFGG